jgi:hypothetical protein
MPLEPDSWLFFTAVVAAAAVQSSRLLSPYSSAVNAVNCLRRIHRSRYRRGLNCRQVLLFFLSFGCWSLWMEEWNVDTPQCDRYIYPIKHRRSIIISWIFIDPVGDVKRHYSPAVFGVFVPFYIVTMILSVTLKKGHFCLNACSVTCRIFFFLSFSYTCQ